MYRRILVGTDGSDSASRAVRHAAWLASSTGSELLLATAYRQEPGAEETRQVGASILRDARALCGDDVDVRALLLEGYAADAILLLARAEAVDLIVVGNRGMSRRQIPIGSVPSRIAHRTPCDVMIAHTAGTMEEGPYARVLVATDGSPTATRAARAGGALARAVGAEALLLHVGDEPAGREALDRTAAELDTGLSPATRIVPGDPARGIVDVAREGSFDVVVVGNRGMMGARRFLASVPSKVARQAPCHVLLVKTT